MNNNSTDSSPGSLLHVVYFWLKNPDDPSARAAFEEAIKKLIRTNPQAIASHLGCPAASEKRAVCRQLFYLLLHHDFSKFRSSEYLSK